jgi:hypothetical protein
MAKFISIPSFSLVALSMANVSQWQFFFLQGWFHSGVKFGYFAYDAMHPS